jgi:hypothetical protein
MACAENGRLLREYQEAVSRWSHLTEEPVTQELSERARTLREAAVNAKKAYLDHVAEHGC